MFELLWGWYNKEQWERLRNLQQKFEGLREKRHRGSDSPQHAGSGEIHPKSSDFSPVSLKGARARIPAAAGSSKTRQVPRCTFLCLFSHQHEAELKVFHQQSDAEGAESWKTIRERSAPFYFQPELPQPRGTAVLQCYEAVPG